MSDDVVRLRLKAAWRECERNVYHLCRVLVLLDPLLPMSGHVFTTLTDDQIQRLDQFVLSFTKLQDAIGGQLFSAVLEYLQEPYEERPMLDKLNRLEKLGYIQSADTWQNIRNTRNKFAHDYPDDGDKNAALINLASEAAEAMYKILIQIESKLNAHQPPCKLGEPLTRHTPWNQRQTAGEQK